MVPRQMRETFRPVWPRRTCSMADLPERIEKSFLETGRLKAKQGCDNPLQQALKFERAGGDRQVDTVLARIGHRIVAHIALHDLQIARRIAAGFVAKTTPQNKRVLQ